MYIHTFMFENCIPNLILCLQGICKLMDVVSPSCNFFLLSTMTVLWIASWIVQYYPDVALAVTAQFSAKSLLMSAFKTPCKLIPHSSWDIFRLTPKANKQLKFHKYHYSDHNVGWNPGKQTRTTTVKSMTSWSLSNWVKNQWSELGQIPILRMGSLGRDQVLTYIH